MGWVGRTSNSLGLKVWIAAVGLEPHPSPWKGEVPSLAPAANAALVASAILFFPTKKATEANWRQNQLTSIASAFLAMRVI